MLFLYFLILFSQDWFAFLGNGSDSNFTLAGEAVFNNSGAPTVDNNYGFCQVSVSAMHLPVIRNMCLIVLAVVVFRSCLESFVPVHG